MRRVVISGLGVISPLGCGAELVWGRLLASGSGIRRLDDSVVFDVPSKIGGVVPSDKEDALGGFTPDRYLNPKDQRKMDRFIHFAVAAADEALAHAQWHPQTDRERERTATIIATGVGGFPAMMGAAHITDEKGVRQLSPFTIPSFLANLAAGQVSIRHRLKGPLGTPVTACAASVQSIGDGARLIRNGEVDVALVGGAEACIHRVSLGGFAAARALSTSFNDNPTKASRPFDQNRDGFVMGEGAAMLVIEDLEHARARGARPIAEIIGYGTTADAHHITSAPEGGEGAQRAMKLALEQAAISAADIGYLNAHATSTQIGDRGELAAILGIFGAKGNLAISSTKSATGHMLGAAGAIEAVFTALSLRDGLLPPTLNLERVDDMGVDLDLIGPIARKRTVEFAMSNGLGFGGVNASIVLKAYS